VRKALLAAAIGLLLWSAVVAVTGGIDQRVFGVPIKSRDPIRAVLAASAVAVLYAIFFTQDLAHFVDRAVWAARARAAPFAAVIAVSLGVYGVVFATFSVGGSDAYGYINQAYDWKAGVLPEPITLTRTLPFELADRLQAPLGYREGREPHTIVPTYAPGLPLIMALTLLAGSCGPFLVGPVSAVLFVWCTYKLGVRAGGPLVGLAAAMILSVSPVVLHQTVWPMSDVPAGAVWTGSIVLALGARRRAIFASGLLAAVGLLIRPNLAAAVLALLPPILWTGSLRERVIRLIAFGMPVALAALIIGWLNALWYGSAFNSGYGSAGELYLWSNVVPNLKLYAQWLWRSQTPLLLIVIALLVPRLRRAFDRRALLMCVLFAIAVTACYASYAQFEEWWYLRFLLPAFGALLVLAAAGLVAVARALPRPFGAVAAGLVVALAAARCVTFAANEGTFRIRENEHRYGVIGSFASGLPRDSVLLAVQHSGSLRFLTGLPVVRFDGLDHPRSLEVIQALERGGLHPFLVIDDAEMPDVRVRFGIAAAASIPWPVRARMQDLGGVTVYDLASAPVVGAPVALEPAAARRCASRAPLVR
jgi:hypothetical protein